MRIALAICALLSAALIVFLAYFWVSVDLTSSSTAGLAYIWIPVWGVLGLSLIWGGIFATLRYFVARFANRSAKPS
jgi:hypothetical protein